MTTHADTSHASSNGTPSTPDALHVAFVLDESGSMTDLAPAVVTGFAEFLDELRADPGDTRFTLTLFDTTVTHVHVAGPLADVPSLATTGYRPGWMTALFDAVAHAVLETDGRLTAEGKADEKVMVVVMTDGLENSSTDYTAETIAALVSEYEERPNWTFVYLGAAHASLDGARAAAGRMAFKAGNAMRWQAEPVAARKSMSSLAHAARVRRASAARKSEALFAEAGQGESDYRETGCEPGTITRGDVPDLFAPKRRPRS